MGEAREIVGTPKDEYPQPARKDGVTSVRVTVLSQLTETIDDLDRAIRVKQKDLTSEGHSAVPENHYKLGILKGADSLVRRARAMLQDYGLDLDEIGIKEDPQAAKGEEIEAHADLANAVEQDEEDESEECPDCGETLDSCICDEEDAAEDGPLDNDKGKC
jgi:hypothetical protein